MTKGQESSVVDYDLLFATDGAGSAVRKSLIQLFPEQYVESVDWLSSDYKELHMPALASGASALQKNNLHIWPRATHMMMGLANQDASFTMTLYLPRDHHRFSFTNLQSESEVQNLFTSEFADSIPLLHPNYAQEFLQNPQGKLATVRLNKWVYGDSVALLGDAAHAIVPFFGQGMNLGFEDCTEMIRLYDESKQDWPLAFQNYDKLRRPQANAIADMALENFTEMRDKVGDAHFQLKKKIEVLIEKEFSDRYRSRYGLITYTLTPFATAQQAGLKQNKILDTLASEFKTAENLNLAKARDLLERDYFPWAQSLQIETRSYKP